MLIAEPFLLAELLNVALLICFHQYIEKMEDTKIVADKKYNLRHEAKAD